MNKRLLACGFILSLSACESVHQQVFEPIDQSHKTITLPAGNLGLMSPIKQKLRADGWQLVVDQGPVVADEVTEGKTKHTTAAMTFRTRYRLEVDQHMTNDFCMISGDPVVIYSLSLIDNASGQEALAQSGRDCTGIAANHFIKVVDPSFVP